jgi:hypothetical protein
MGVGLNGIGRLSKDLEGFLETLYSFTNLSPAAIDIARGLSRQQQIYFENSKEFRELFPYSDIRVKQGVKELCDKGFILTSDKRGSYKLNEAIFIFTPAVSFSIKFNGGQITLHYEAA